MKKRLCLLLCLLLTAALLCGCQAEKPLAGDLMTNIRAEKQDQPTQTAQEEKAGAVAVCDFAVRLFNANPDNAAQNTLISPLSVLLALSMTANGAAENTLAQMETALGLPLEDLNRYLSTYIASLPQTEKCSLHIANSLWLNDDQNITVKQDILQTNANYYGADVFQLPFDENALNQINSWVSRNTNGMIDKMLDAIKPEAVIYLINALAFEAEWENMYSEHQIGQDIFTAADGREQKTDFMFSAEDIYLQDENTQGFIKYYASQKYAFAALLPNEDIPLADYTAALTGEKLYRLLNNQQSVDVHTSIPRFENEFTLNLVPLLQSMGITNAFDPNLADFSGMADNDLYIDQVLHKTYIKVNENGTKAAAATLVAAEAGARPSDDYKEVYLNRPFVYLLIDCQSNLPLFIGTVTSLE